MVDKIKSRKSVSVQRAQSLQAASAISSTKLKACDLNEIKRSRQATRELNADEREQLKKIMREESVKMFGKGHTLPEAQRKIIEHAIEMAIDSANIEENS